jgi:hypothetical protein
MVSIAIELHLERSPMESALELEGYRALVTGGTRPAFSKFESYQAALSSL